MPDPQHRPNGEDLDATMPGTDPEITEEKETSRKGMEMRADFQQTLINVLKQPMKMADVAWELHRLLPTLKTPLGAVRQVQSEVGTTRCGP